MPSPFKPCLEICLRLRHPKVIGFFPIQTLLLYGTAVCFSTVPANLDKQVPMRY